MFSQNIYIQVVDSERFYATLRCKFWGVYVYGESCSKHGHGCYPDVN